MTVELSYCYYSEKYNKLSKWKTTELKNYLGEPKRHSRCKRWRFQEQKVVPRRAEFERNRAESFEHAERKSMFQILRWEFYCYSDPLFTRMKFKPLVKKSFQLFFFYAKNSIRWCSFNFMFSLFRINNIRLNIKSWFSCEENISMS
jgi:hypothetical protein